MKRFTSCCPGKKRKSVGATTPWQDRLVDVLLSLSAYSSAQLPSVPLREAVEAVFRAFASDISQTGMLLLDLLTLYGPMYFIASLVAPSCFPFARCRVQENEPLASCVPIANKLHDRDHTPSVVIQIQVLLKLSITLVLAEGLINAGEAASCNAISQLNSEATP